MTMTPASRALILLLPRNRKRPSGTRVSLRTRMDGMLKDKPGSQMIRLFGICGLGCRSHSLGGRCDLGRLSLGGVPFY